MVYTKYDKLSVIQVNSDEEQISFNLLGKVMQERPSEVVYCECNGRLYGMISMYDIFSAEKDRTVKINKNFVSIKPYEYMKARQIFMENSRINAIPVVGDDGQLLGDYASWDDLIILEHASSFFWGSQMANIWEKIHSVALVKPSDIFQKKQRFLSEWQTELEARGIQVVVIDRMKVTDYISKVDYVLMVDAREFYGTFILLRTILREPGNWGNVVSYRNIVMDKDASKRVYEYENEMGYKALNKIRQAGVHILTIQAASNGSKYSNDLRNRFLQRFPDGRIGAFDTLSESILKDFFAELYTKDYAQSMLEPPFRTKFVRRGVRQLLDVSGKYQNIQAGERLTVGQPEQYDRTIYFFGPCIIYGHYCEDKHTIPSFVQAKCNEKGLHIKVVNLGAKGHFALEAVGRMYQTPMKEGDIAVVYFNNQKVGDIDNLNLEDTLEQKQVPAEYMFNTSFHVNHKVHQIYADAIYDKLRPLLEDKLHLDSNTIMVNQDECFPFTDGYLKYYFWNFDAKSHGVVGSIVMNCNPFTDGHYYLIEEALRNIDFLIIFVVEENRSVFSFAERFSSVCAGVAKFHNVMVVPSGTYILSEINFPEYFVKKDDEDIALNIENDLTIFAEQIAPMLNITYRFVGEEPEDVVTNRYNMMMKRILPSYGIQVIEIPRKKKEERVISASAVRKCLEGNDFTGLEKLIPETTKSIMFFNND